MGKKAAPGLPAEITDFLKKHKNHFAHVVVDGREKVL
jgi:hypothetical protein